MMKAVQVMAYGEPENMKMNEIPKPTMESGEMMIRVKASGINPVETYIRSAPGVYGNHKVPFILGSDFAGVVEDFAPDFKSTKFKKGTRVFGFMLTKIGTYCEYITVDPSKEIVGVLPDHCSFELGASIGIPYFTTYKALFSKANATSGQTVLVHGGSGGVGVAVIQIAKCKGLNVFATAGTAKGKEMCEAAGADYTFYHNQENYEKEMMEVATTKFGGFDIIFENAAHFNIDRDLDMIKRGGTILIVGARFPRETNLRAILAKEVRVQGLLLLNTPYDEFTYMLKDVEEHLEKGNFKDFSVSYDMSQAAETHREIINPSSGGATGKIVITM